MRPDIVKARRFTHCATSPDGITETAWGDILPNQVMTASIPDRLLHHCHVVRIDGRSFRLREMEKASAGK